MSAKLREVREALDDAVRFIEKRHGQNWITQQARSASATTVKLIAEQEGYIMVSVDKVRNARHQAKLAANSIVGFSEKWPDRMCGWLDDACTAADIAADDLGAMLAAAPTP